MVCINNKYRYLSSRDNNLIYYFYCILVKEQLEGFGVSLKAIARALKTKTGAPITADEIKLDENHPPPEALGYILSYIKPYLQLNAWKKVGTSSMYKKGNFYLGQYIHVLTMCSSLYFIVKALQNDWECQTCTYAKLGNMIMCEFCSRWHHWSVFHTFCYFVYIFYII